MIHLTESTVEELASRALQLDTVLDLGPASGGARGYASLIELLKDADVFPRDLREAAEQGIWDFLHGQMAYIRQRVKVRLAEMRKELVESKLEVGT